MHDRSINLISRLQTLGMSGEEAEAYVAVLKLGLCKVDQISRETGLYRAQIYELMPRLIALGLIEEVVGRPKRYCARALREPITNLRDQTLSRYRGLQQDGHRLIQDLERLQARITDGEELQVRVITGVENIERHLQERVESVKQEILLAANFSAAPRWRSFIRKVNPGIQSRKLRVLAILEVSAETAGYAKWLSSGFEVRHHESLYSYMCLFDDRSAVIGLTSSNQTRPERLSALVANYPDYVRFLRDLFEATWNDSVPLTVRLASLQGNVATRE